MQKNKFLKKNNKNITKKIIGTSFLTIGIIGFVLPVIPGFLFFFPGLSMIDDDFSKNMKKSTRRYKYHKDKIKFVREVISDTKNVIKKSKGE